MSLPEKYLDSMKALLKDDYAAYIESFNEKRLYGLRINTLKISPEEFLKISPFDLKPIPWIENGFYYSENDKPSRHPYYFAGLYYIQEPSAMTPANLLPIEKDDIVFDMCAAPGGKSTELGAKLKHTGLLITNDISNSRAKALLKNVEVSGIPNLCVLSEDPQKLASHYKCFFDKVLIDAPCSGEGMFRKDNKLIKSWSKNGPEFYSQIQKNIILSGADMLKPGGMMLYSTCTFSKLEDEETILYLLSKRPDMHIVSVKEYEGFSHGIADDAFSKANGIDKTVRIFPHKMQGEGHFIALLQKDGEKYPNTISRTKSSCKLTDELKEFLKHLSYPLDYDNIEIRDNRVFCVSKYMCEEKGLRIMRNGLLIGELKKNRFEPSQALAMVIKSTEYDNVLNLSVTDERVIKYLKGDTLDVSDKEGTLNNGWVLICVDGYPLGWGKYNAQSIKNKYLAGWRWV